MVLLGICCKTSVISLHAVNKALKQSNSKETIYKQFCCLDF